MKPSTLSMLGAALGLVGGVQHLGSPLDRARRSLPLSARKPIAQHRIDMERAAQKRERKRLRALELQARLDAKHGAPPVRDVEEQIVSGVVGHKAQQITGIQAEVDRDVFLKGTVDC